MRQALFTFLLLLSSAGAHAASIDFEVGLGNTPSVLYLEDGYKMTAISSSAGFSWDSASNVNVPESGSVSMLVNGSTPAVMNLQGEAMETFPPVRVRLPSVLRAVHAVHGRRRRRRCLK